MRFISLFVVLSFLTGCAVTQPTIDSPKVAKATTVVIEDIPELNVGASVSILLTRRVETYFSGKMDYLYTSPQIDALPPAGIELQSAMAVAGAGNEHPKYFREDFERIVGKQELKSEFFGELTNQLRARGVDVRIDTSTRELAPRARWAFNPNDSSREVTPRQKNSEVADADLLIQVAPIAAYVAIGRLSNFRIEAGVAVIVYDARTKEFLGWQAFRAPDSPAKYEYSTMKELKASLPESWPIMRKALLDLVPQVVAAVRHGT